MGVSNNGARARLVVPVAAVIVAIQLAAAVRAVWFGDVATLVIASGPFGLLCGYLFGASLIRGEK